MAKNSKKEKKQRGPFWTIVLFALIGLALSIALVTNLSHRSLMATIHSFDPVQYSDQLVPVKGEEGFYTITTDRDLKIMNITDIHIGGSRWTLVKDEKAVYEVMSMISKEKPDLVLLDGDQVFAVPGPIFRGGGTINNKKAEKYICEMFEQLGVYYSLVFGNHDTEAFDLYDREAIGELYEDEKYEHCIFESNYNGYGVTNQCILLKNTDGSIRKALMLIDSNDYIDNSIMASINWLYDTIHDEQVIWAKETLESLSAKQGETVKSLFFFHIPVGEFETAYRELDANGFKDTENTKYISGVWNEEISEEFGIRIWYGGCQHQERRPEDNDILFETIGPDGLNSLEGIFCGHDHSNNAVVEYRGVTLSYGYSIDNTAYDGIQYSGLQRGCTVISISKDGTWSEEHKNAYLDYGVSTDKFFDVYLDHQYYDDYQPQ